MRAGRRAPRASRISPVPGALLGLAILLGPGAAAGDWLVTRDGERIESAGAWSERGALVVFRLADGTLASLRRSEVDLEASRAATAEALRPETDAPPEAAPPTREAVMVLTDDDMPRRWPEPDGGEPPEEDDPADRVQVVEWREEVVGDGLAIVGRVANVSDDDAVARVTVIAHLLGPEGDEIASAAASLDRSALMPGEQTDFVVAFDRFHSFSELRFATQALALRSGPPARTGLAPLEEPPPGELPVDEPGAAEPLEAAGAEGAAEAPSSGPDGDADEEPEASQP